LPDFRPALDRGEEPMSSRSLLVLSFASFIFALGACDGVTLPPIRRPNALGPANLVDQHPVVSEGPRVLDPGWVEGGTHSGYDPRRYLYGVGFAATTGEEAEYRRSADEDARGKIALTLRSDIEKTITSLQSESGRATNAGAQSDVRVEFRDLTKVVGRATLDGAEVVARHINPETGTAYSLAVMDRGVAAKNAAARVLAAREQAVSQLELAGRMSARGERASSLGVLLAAYESCLEAQIGDGAHRVLVGKAADVELPDRTSEVRRALEEFRVALRIEVVRGQDQKGAVGAALPQPVVLRAVLVDGEKTISVPGVSFSLRSEDPKAVKLSADHIVTNSEGEASFQVLLAESTGKAAHAILASLDAARMGSFEIPDVRVRYTVPTTDTLRVLVVIDERSLGREVDSSSVAIGIEDALSDAGIQIVSSSRFVDRIGKDRLLTGSVETLSASLAGDVDFIVRGRAEARESQSGLSLPSARATAKIQGLDLVSGQSVLSFEPKPVPEARSSREKAAEIALQLIGKDTGKEVARRLKKILAGMKP
jgi:hypothetical protein